MKCPYCNKEMESGYVQCRDGLHWTPKKQKVAALSGMGKGAIAIGNDNGYMANSSAVAFHCEDCKTVIIQYGNIGKKDTQSDISDSIGIDVSKGTVLTDSDSHGGFHGDGMMFQQISFEDSKLLDEIKDNGSWKTMPLSQNIEALVYGVEEDTSRIGPYLTDESGDTIIPNIQNGYYYFYDRHSESKEPYNDEDVLNRASFNFTLAVYDSDNHVLYYVEFDT